MAKYNKFIGSIVGGLVGAGLAALGVAEATIPAVAGPITDAILVIVLGSIGTFIAPKNAE